MSIRVNMGHDRAQGNLLLEALYVVRTHQIGNVQILLQEMLVLCWHSTFIMFLVWGAPLFQRNTLKVVLADVMCWAHDCDSDLSLLQRQLLKS